MVALLFWAAVVFCGWVAYAPVSTSSLNTDEGEFSLRNAEAILESLVGDSIPHPAGSKQNAIVRQKIVALLEFYGYSVEVQRGSAPVPDWLQSRVEGKTKIELNNIYATSKEPDQPPGKAIMLVSHYDSTSRGPGASDDGVGTAALIEIARLLSENPLPGRQVNFLITDGEELGLLGAKLFVDEHPGLARVGVVINLEARGTTGPSMMFETSRYSRKLIPIFARSSRRPFASSLFFEIYKAMPNDTDFTVFRKAGLLGYNFAFIGDVKNYHTTADNFANVDRGSLQHHGENALELMRGLAESTELAEALESQERADRERNVDSNQNEEVVYFDFFGRFLVWWPSNWSIWLTFVSGVLFAISSRFFWSVENKKRTLQRDGQKELSVGFARQFFSSLGIQLVAIVAIFAAVYWIQYSVRLDPRLSNPWPRQPVPILLGYALASCSIVGLVTLIFHKWLIHLGAWSATGAIWIAMAVLTSLYVSGASYLFILPMLIVSLFGLLACWFGTRGLLCTIVVTAMAVGLIWLPMERLFYDGVGFKLPLAMLFRFSMLATAIVGLLSLCDRRTKFNFLMITSVGAVVALVIAIWLNTEGG